MKALVTGGAGFIGAHVVRALLQDGWEVRVLHLPKEKLGNLQGLDVERIAGDVTEPAALPAAVRGCDAVFHLAAVYALWLPKPERMRQVNVEGTRNVLSAAADAGVKRVVYTSSIAVFGGQGPGRDGTEKSPFALAATGDLYSIAKYESHRVAEEFARSDLDVVLVAPTGPLGPGDIGPTPTGKLLLSVVNMPAPVILDSESNVGDVRDIARGHLSAFHRGKRGESYLLGNKNVSMRELAETVLRVAGLDRAVRTAPAPLAKIAARALLWHAERVSRRAPLFTPAAVEIARLGLRADCSKARTELGLPTRPLEETVRDALAWFAARGKVRDPAVRERLLAGENV